MTAARAALAALLLLPSPAIAQAPLRIEAATASSYRAAPDRRPAAYPAAALEALGATLQPQAAGLRVLLFGDTLHFDAQSPFFRAGARSLQLIHAPFAIGGALFLPEQFYIEWLPARYPARIAYRAGALHLLNAVARTAPTPAAPRDSVVPSRDNVVPTRDARAAPAPAPAPAGAATQRVVILDPGHGGRDPGKVGPGGIREKDVALQLSQRLAGLLRERGYEVHLTRTKDTLIALTDRPRLANQWKGGRPSALYMSIHANAGATSARGFETYFLSDARTEDERRVAEMENAAVAYEDGPRVTGEGLDHILNGLRNDFYIKASNDLAEVVQKRLSVFHPGPNRGVKQAGFVVLVGAFMPAVLVEAGFISNRQEAGLLGAAAFQQKIAYGLADAVDQFFRSHEYLWVSE